MRTVAETNAEALLNVFQLFGALVGEGYRGFQVERHAEIDGHTFSVVCFQGDLPKSMSFKVGKHGAIEVFS